MVERPSRARTAQHPQAGAAARLSGIDSLPAPSPSRRAQLWYFLIVYQWPACTFLLFTASRGPLRSISDRARPLSRLIV